MLGRFLRSWTAWVADHAGPVMGTCLVLTAGAAWYAITAFSMNSDTSRLIRQETGWKQVNTEFVNTFPQYDQNTFVVVSGPRPAAVASFTRDLTQAIRNNDDVFSLVYSPASSDFADRYALLYLDTDDLSLTMERLAEAQPFLTAVAEDGTLRAVLKLATDALEADEDLPSGFVQMSEALNLAAEHALSGDSRAISWRDELFDIEGEDTFYQVIFVKGRQDFGVDLPNATIIGRLESVIGNFEHPYSHDMTVRLTGQVPLEHGEIVSAMDSAKLAGTLALFLLIGVLIWGVRSLRIIAATYIAMLVGLVWTAAFAMVAVGQYNTISIIFLVMFIGLGVDFAVHLCLKYQEARTTSGSRDALLEMGTELGPAIILCGITSAIGFLAFVPTDYLGLAEMGVISGGGMIIAVIISLTLIPAFFALTGDPREPLEMPLSGLLTSIVARRTRLAAYATLLLGVVLTAIATQAHFDYSTLSLKDPDSEAMTTLAELHDQDIITDYSLMYIAGSLIAAEADREKLETLDVVSEVSTPVDYLPLDQQEKRYILEDAMFFLDSVFSAKQDDTPFPDDALLEALTRLNNAIEAQLAGPGTTLALRTALRQLGRSTQALTRATPAVRQQFTSLILPPIKQELAWLKTALHQDHEITVDNLPSDLKDRLIAGDGRVVVTVTPKEDVLPVEAMRRFTEEVIAVVPDITGRPVLDLGIGDIVIRAFLTAIAIAVSVIFAILLVALRSVVDAVLVFIPLLMTAMVTLAVSVLIDMPLNMANVVVIPLIFGLGVDNGIHIVKRFHQTGDAREFVNCSTPKAVFLSNLTTLGTFGALSFSTHQGIYSIGILLTVALASLMLLTLVALPALLETFSTRRPALATGH